MTVTVTAETMANFAETGANSDEQVSLWVTDSGVVVHTGPPPPPNAIAYLMPWDAIWWEQFGGDATQAAGNVNHVLSMGD